MRRRIVLVIFLLFLALVTPSVAEVATWSVDPAHSGAHFSVRHMMVSNVRGEFGKISGAAQFDPKDPTVGSVEITIDATSINTRNPKRDAHLRSADFFDVEKFPTITFKSKKVELASPGRLKVTGDLTIHGAAREVVLDVEGPTPEIKDAQGRVRTGATATTRVNRKDFGLLWNRPLEAGGWVVGDEVAITVDVELIRKAPPGT